MMLPNIMTPSFHVLSGLLFIDHLGIQCYIAWATESRTKQTRINTASGNEVHHEIMRRIISQSCHPAHFTEC
jgi:hypothetical protein